MRTLSILLALLLSACGQKAPVGPAPYQIHIVGSTAAFPYSTVVAERFMREKANAIAPLVQAAGNSDGFARFCRGIGRLHPDIVGATRDMTAAERTECAKNGTGRIETIPIGTTAIVLVARKDDPALALTTQDLNRALASDAPTWSAVDRGLPATPIRIHGPVPALADALVPARPRRDGGYRTHGADANLVASTVAETPGAIGIIPYADALAHADTLRILPLDGVMPSPRSIADRRYPATLPILLFVKADQAAKAPGLLTMLGYFGDSWGAGGRFATRGLVPLPETGQKDSAGLIAALSHL